MNKTFGWLGCAVAFSLSWTLNQSIFWAIVHTTFSWFYVGYIMMPKYISYFQ